MDEQLLITAVAAHGSLYDPTHNKYKDVELRNAIWQQIAEDLKMEANPQQACANRQANKQHRTKAYTQATNLETCKAKWRTLRDGFTRALRQQREAKNVLPSKAKKPWRYQNEMEFLIPFIYTRESRSNHLDQETEGVDYDFPTKAAYPNGDYESSVFRDNDETLSVTSNTGPEPPLLFPMTPLNSHNPSSLKRQLEPVDSDEVFDYLQCKKQEMEVILKERGLSSPRSAHCQCRCSTDDPTEAFFFSMGQSVKRLPFYLQAQVKMKVCQLVTDAEMECLDSASVQ